MVTLKEVSTTGKGGLPSMFDSSDGSSSDAESEVDVAKLRQQMKAQSGQRRPTSAAEKAANERMEQQLLEREKLMSSLSRAWHPDEKHRAFVNAIHSEPVFLSHVRTPPAHQRERRESA